MSEENSIERQLQEVDNLIRDILSTSEDTHQDDERIQVDLHSQLQECVNHRTSLMRLTKKLKNVSDLISTTKEKFEETETNDCFVRQAKKNKEIMKTATGVHPDYSGTVPGFELPTERKVRPLTEPWPDNQD